MSNWKNNLQDISQLLHQRDILKAAAESMIEARNRGCEQAAHGQCAVFNPQGTGCDDLACEIALTRLLVATEEPVSQSESRGPEGSPSLMYAVRQAARALERGYVTCAYNLLQRLANVCVGGGH